MKINTEPKWYVTKVVKKQVDLEKTERGQLGSKGERGTLWFLDGLEWQQFSGSQIVLDVDSHVHDWELTCHYKNLHIDIKSY